jgi:hypothetical protein
MDYTGREALQPSANIFAELDSRGGEKYQTRPPVAASCVIILK